jgi:probable rRNA maturation factor
MPTRTLAITNRHPRLQFERRAVRKAMAALDAHAAAFKVPSTDFLRGELSVVFLTDAALADLHAEFLDDATTTDVITFEGDPAHGVAGEICVSVDTAAAYARAHGRDFSTELTLYLVHGWLHLAGYDDLIPLKKRAMRRAEVRGMKYLAALIPPFKLRPAR